MASSVAIAARAAERRFLTLGKSVNARHVATSVALPAAAGRYGGEDAQGAPRAAFLATVTAAVSLLAATGTTAAMEQAEEDVEKSAARSVDITAQSRREPKTFEESARLVELQRRRDCLKSEMERLDDLKRRWEETPGQDKKYYKRSYSSQMQDLLRMRFDDRTESILTMSTIADPFFDPFCMWQGMRSPFASSFGIFNQMDDMMQSMESHMAEGMQTAAGGMSTEQMLSKAKSLMEADPSVRNVLGDSLALGRPVRQSAQSVTINGETTSRVQLLIPVQGKDGSGQVYVFAEGGGIVKLNVEAQGHLIEILGNIEGCSKFGDAKANTKNTIDAGAAEADRLD